MMMLMIAAGALLRADDVLRFLGVYLQLRVTGIF
jgi:hypothetical protein